MITYIIIIVIMDILYKPAFRNFVKKQPRSFQLAIEDQTEKIRENPSAGEEKKGALSGFRIHKFAFKGQAYLIAYELQNNCIIVYMIDTHENFYRNLKRYIKGG